MSRLLAAVAVAAAAFGPLTQVAHADVDPASDVLLLQNVYRPYGPPYGPATCKELTEALDTLTDRTRKAGYPLKVALIATKTDLGGAPQLWRKPQAYAEFLNRELAYFGGKKERAKKIRPLLVVMPVGFGVADAGPKARAALGDLSIPADAKANDLARVATGAVPALARAAGHPIGPVKLASGCHTGGGGTSPLVFAAPVLILVLGIAAVAVIPRVRRRSAD